MLESLSNKELEERRRQKRENRKKFKWARHMPHKLVQEVMSLNPDRVTFYKEYPKYIQCEIRKGTELGSGVAICSPTEEYFIENKAKEMALGLALGALKRKDNKFRIRDNFTEFPKNWTIGQAERIMEVADIFGYRSIYEDTRTW
jgi:hypothetical protein